MSNMNGGVMKSQRARVGAGYQPPALPFAQLPNPDSVLGRVYTASDVGPAPGIELIAAPGRWRPRGGRQVLAMRTNNPVTVQSLTDQIAETIGPFPGGFVRAGMQLRCALAFFSGGIGTGAKIAQMWIGNSGSVSSAGTFSYLNNTGNNINSNGEMEGRIDVRSDTNAQHYARPGAGPNANGVLALSNGFFHTLSLASNPTVIFSSPWEIAVVLRSAAETAVNISSATWAGGIATFNTSAAHTLAVGDKTVIAGVTPSGYNIPAGAIVLSVPTTTQFTVALAADPGTYTSGGTSSRISNVTSQSYVLELVG